MTMKAEILERVKQIEWTRATARLLVLSFAALVLIALVALTWLAGVFGPGEVWALFTAVLEAQGLVAPADAAAL